MINGLFDLSRIHQVLSGCKNSLKIRISHKPGLGLLHKFILSADGAHVFLILPPEFQVCQERSKAAKDFFFQEQNEPELFGRSRIGLFLSTSVSYLPPRPFPHISRRRPHSVHPWGMGNSACDPQKTYF